MPGDIGRIPIISLSSCKSLTDILPELPLPQPTHASIAARNILFDQKITEDAYRCVNSREDELINQLVLALGSTSTDSM
ncbi:unnamed protein product [Protopolystoma xenopodis]|uniref:Uncharacterized protein n=1 Tax=Protopolystoma xenopodis TaxID=117903 RepID=A0A448WN87_9PLAT|nr:unnamed protein product [Protopolystoma xenopodis]